MHKLQYLRKEKIFYKMYKICFGITINISIFSDS